MVTVTFADFVSLQPAVVVTVTWSVSVPTMPAVKLMLLVPLPLLIVPLVIDHAYVAPTPALATEAVLEVVDIIEPGAVIAAFGFGLTVTTVDADGLLVQPDVVTVTVYPPVALAM